MRSMIGSLLLVAGVALPAVGAPEEAIQILESIPTESAQLEVWVNSGAGRDLEQGEAMELHLRTDQAGHVVLLYLDSQGKATVVSELIEVGRWSLEAGEHRAVSAGTAGPPYGQDSLIAVATREPIQIGTGRDSAVAVAERLRELSGGSVLATARYDVGIVKQREGVRPQYDPVEIAANLEGQHTRGIPQPKIDLDIKFALDSEQLTEQAKVDLEANAQAIMSARLHGFRFQLEGHTDDLGDDPYNLDLSQRRADEARKYMLECCRVEAERVQAVGRGELDPLRPGTSKTDRRENRRVVLKLVR